MPAGKCFARPISRNCASIPPDRAPEEFERIRDAYNMARNPGTRVLVDVLPYSFGISYVGERNGHSYPYCYHPIITRNTPLPVTRTESYFTTHPFQTAIRIEVYQGDSPDALKNLPVDEFFI